jgi:hypothetical protein
VAVGCSGSQRDFPNFAPRMLRLPRSRSTSARTNPTGSLMRIPVTANRPNKVA